MYQAPLGGDPLLKKMDLPHADKTWAHLCVGYKRYLLPPDIRESVDKYWPKEQPRYWVLDNFDVASDIGRALQQSKAIRSDTDRDPPHRFDDLGPVSASDADYGLPTRAGGGSVSTAPPLPITLFPPAYYPATNDYRLDRWPADRSKWTAYVAEHKDLADVDIDFRNGVTRGFAYCFVSIFPNTELTPYLEGKRIVGRIDRDVIVTNRTPFIAPPMIFEHDTHVFLYFRINLESTRGDV